MSSLDDIIDQVRDQAGADFAFVLSNRGRLVTRHAPENMPEKGRLELANAAAVLVGTDNVTMRTMPREALVPYGGAAPIDVFIAAREVAILCVVMATWSDKVRVVPALLEGFVLLDAFIGGELEKRGAKTGRRRKKSSESSELAPRVEIPAAPPVPKKVPPSRGGRRSVAPSPESTRGRTLVPPAEIVNPRNTLPFDPGVGAHSMALPPTKPTRKAAWGRGRSIPAPHDSTPEITVGEASVGRATLAAIEVDATGPEISYSTSKIGRETLAAIETSTVPAGRHQGSAPELRVSLATYPELDAPPDSVGRHTLPFTELPTDARRTYEAQVKTRNAAPPEVTVRLTNLDWDVQNAAIEDVKKELETSARLARQETEARAPLDSSVDAWRQALTEFVLDESQPKKRRRSQG